jgi:hypothetical protein
MRRRPADRLKEASRQRASASADQPIAAVICGTEHQIVVTEQAEGGGDMVSRDRRDVGADDDDGSGGQAGKRPRHPPAEIAAALRDPPTGNAPEPRSRGVAVGRQRQPAAPAAIRGDAAQQPRRVVALEAQRRERADPGRETPLDAAQRGRLGEYHEIPARPHA